MRIDIGGGNFLETGPGAARVEYADGGRYALTLSELGEIAEWLAVAWENVANEGYRPVIISKRGYVADEGLILIEDAAKIASRLDRQVHLERDCE